MIQIPFLLIYTWVIVNTLNVSYGGSNLMETHAEHNELVLDGCFHKDSKEINYVEVNNMLLGKLCDWAFTERRELVVTSTYRPHGRAESQHFTGNAVDGYLDFTGLVGVCAVLKQYKEDIFSLLEWIRFTGTRDKHGMGVYPYKLIFHLDNRGKHARWAFDEDDNEIKFKLGLELLNERIDDECYPEEEET